MSDFFGIGRKPLRRVGAGRRIARRPRLQHRVSGKIVSVSKHELAGKADRIGDFISLVRDFGIIDMARSGRVAIARRRE